MGIQGARELENREINDTKRDWESKLSDHTFLKNLVSDPPNPAELNLTNYKFMLIYIQFFNQKGRFR